MQSSEHLAYPQGTCDSLCTAAAIAVAILSPPGEVNLPRLSLVICPCPRLLWSGGQPTQGVWLQAPQLHNLAQGWPHGVTGRPNIRKPRVGVVGTSQRSSLCQGLAELEECGLRSPLKTPRDMLAKFVLMACTIATRDLHYFPLHSILPVHRSPPQKREHSWKLGKGSREYLKP